MRKLLMVLLSLIFIISAVSAIVITEIDDDKTTAPVTIAAGENISVSIIKDALNETKEQLVTELEEVVLIKTIEFETKIDNYFSIMISKIGLGFLALALFIFNLILAKKLLIDMVFKDGS